MRKCLRLIKKNPDFPRDEINISIEEFVRLTLLFSLSVYLFPEFEINKKNSLLKAFPQNYYLLYNMDRLLEVMMEYFCEELEPKEDEKTILENPIEFLDHLLQDWQNFNDMRS